MSKIEKKIAELLVKKSLPEKFAGAVLISNDLKEDSDEDTVAKAVDKFEILYRTHIQPEIDRRVDGGLKTWREKHGIELDETGKPVIKDRKNEGGDNEKSPKKPIEEEEEKVDIPPGLKALYEEQLKVIKSLSDEVKQIKEKTIRQTTLEKAKKLFESHKNLKDLQRRKPEIAEKWLSRIDTSNPETIEDQIKNLDDEAGALFEATREDILGSEDLYVPRKPVAKTEEDFLKLMDGEMPDKDPSVKQIDFPE